MIPHDFWGTCALLLPAILIVVAITRIEDDLSSLPLDVVTNFVIRLVVTVSNIVGEFAAIAGLWGYSKLWIARLVVIMIGVNLALVSALTFPKEIDELSSNTVGLLGGIVVPVACLIFGGSIFFAFIVMK